METVTAPDGSEIGFCVDDATDSTDPECVLLTNSLGSDVTMWDPQATALNEQFRVVRMDTRGHGSSSTPDGAWSMEDLARDMAAVLDALGVRRAHLAGLSLGGMAAMKFASLFPERALTLSVVCSSAHLPPAQAWHDRAASVRASGIETIADAVLGRWFTPGFASRDSATYSAAIRMLFRVDPEGYARCCEAIAGLDLRRELPRICAPTLAIAGAEDVATPSAHLRFVADNVQRGSVVSVPGAAHMASLEQPGVLSSLLASHMTNVVTRP